MNRCKARPKKKKKETNSTCMGNREVSASSVIRSVANEDEDSALARVALCLRGEQLLLGRLAAGACYLALPRHM
jgi:hypothetical protein